MAEINDPNPSDNSVWLLTKILRRLKDILTATQAPVTIGDVTLTASDIEIGAVEIKNGADDTRAVVKTSDGGAGEAGILVRAIPSATAQPVSISGTVPVSDGGGSLTVDGAVSVSNFPATQAVTSTQLPAALVGGRLDINIGAASGALPVTDNGGSLTVDGPLTDAELRASAVPVSGTFFQATQPVSIAAPVPVTDNGGSLTVDGTFFQATQPVSIAVAVPVTDNGGSLTVDGTVAVSGSVAVTGPLTDTQLRATAVPVADGGGSLTVDGVFFQATQPVSVAAVVHVDDNAGSLTVDGTVAISGSVAVTGPLTDTQLRASAVPVSAATLPLPSGAATETTLASIDAGIPASLGQKTMANSMPVVVASDQSALPVTGTFFQATQPVSIAAAVPVTDNGGSLTVDDGGGSITVDGAVTVSGTATVSGTVAVSNFPASQPVTNAGTFAVQDSEKIVDNAGFTDGSSKVQPAGYIFDEVAGTALTENDAAAARIDSKRAQVFVIEDATTRGQRATVSAAGAVKVDGSAVTQPVSGTFFQATQPVSIAAAVAVTDNGGSLTVDGAVTVSGTVAVSNFPATQPISAVALPLPSGAATESTLASIDAGIPAALGQTTMTLSMPVVIASNQSAVPVSLATIAVTNAGIFLVQDSEKVADNAAFTDGTTKLQPAGFVLDEIAGSTLLTEDDAAAARVDNKRAQIHVIEDRDTRGQRNRVFASGALRVESTDEKDTLYLILEELRESRRILCEIGRLNYETID